MGHLKRRLLFYGLSISAYSSPLLMIISLATNYWLFSSEKITGQQILTKETTVHTTTLSPVSNSTNSTRKVPVKPLDVYYEPLDHIEASYGLWEMCRITGKLSKDLIIF